MFLLIGYVGKLQLFQNNRIESWNVKSSAY